MVFQDRLRQLRKEKELTQLELAEELGISVSALRQYEAGKRDPNFYTVIKLEKFFGVTAAYLNGNVNRCDSNKHFISNLEEELLVSFRELPKEEQDEILGIINLKLQKLKQK